MYKMDSIYWTAVVLIRQKIEAGLFWRSLKDNVISLLQSKSQDRPFRTKIESTSLLRLGFYRCVDILIA